MRKLLARVDFWFWVLAYLVLYGFIHYRPSFPWFGGFTISVTNEQLPTAILIFSLCASSIYAYWFLLLPVTRQSNIFSRGIERLFQIVFVITLLFSGWFILHYTHKLALSDELLRCLGKSTSPSTGALVDSLHFVTSYHLLLFVFFYTLLDFVVIFSTDAVVKSKFKTLVWVIDMPIVISVLFISFVLKDPLGEHFPYVEAAVLSFLMLSGSLSSIVLETWEIRIPIAATATAMAAPPADPQLSAGNAQGNQTGTTAMSAPPDPEDSGGRAPKNESQ